MLASRRLLASLHGPSAAELTPTRLRAVTVVADAGGLRIGELAERVGVEETTATRLVDRLEEAGLVERRAVADDRRATLVALTASGEALAAEVAVQRRRFFGEVLAALEPAEREELVRLTAKAADALRSRSEELIRRVSAAPVILDAPDVLVEGLAVCFGEVEAVRGISFSVAPGEVFGLLGPNGAGKTTTIRVLTTLLRPTGGRALVGGHDAARQGLDVRRAIGYVPQAISVDGALTALENLEFYGRVTGVPRRARRERIAHAVDAMELEPFLDRLGRTLSGGMLRRLEIATALLNRPRVLFLDEPTVGLDPTARRLVWDRLRRLREEAGTTLVVTTHLMEEAERQCDRLAIMDLGEIVAEGTPDELLERYAAATLEDVFTAATGHRIEEGGASAMPAPAAGSRAASAELRLPGRASGPAGSATGRRRWAGRSCASSGTTTSTSSPARCSRCSGSSSSAPRCGATACSPAATTTTAPTSHRA